MTGLDKNWKQGPLPPATYGWGAVVTQRMAQSGAGMPGFLFADFYGDHVKVGGKKIPADEIAFYNNSLTLPKIGTTPKLVATLAPEDF